MQLFDDEIHTKTYPYKKIDDLEIYLDLIRGDDRTGRPVVVWIHGGALINGNREGVNGQIRAMLLRKGYAIASIDYRLAPETKLPHIVEDVEDAFRWIRREGPDRLGIDVSRIAVMGSSAGGYLALVAGYRVDPRPAVVVSLYGYGDLIGSWYSEPSPHARHHGVNITSEEAYRQVGVRPIADSRERSGDGGAFYQYCRQKGLWPKEVSGWDPRKDAEKFYRYMPISNVSEEYPPTLLIHGTEDTDVPYAQSKMMAQLLKDHDVKHELVTVVNGEHGLSGGDPNAIDDAYERAIAFVDRHMKS